MQGPIDSTPSNTHTEIATEIHIWLSQIARHTTCEAHRGAEVEGDQKHVAKEQHQEIQRLTGTLGEEMWWHRAR